MRWCWEEYDWDCCAVFLGNWGGYSELGLGKGLVGWVMVNEVRLGMHLGRVGWGRIRLVG